MNIKRLFFNFLQKHNALKAYKRAFKATIIEYGERTKEYVSLGSSFVWAKTPEGHLYWSSLEMQWHRYFKSIEKKYHF